MPACALYLTWVTLLDSPSGPLEDIVVLFGRGGDRGWSGHSCSDLQLPREGEWLTPGPAAWARLSPGSNQVSSLDDPGGFVSGFRAFCPH